MEIQISAATTDDSNAVEVRALRQWLSHERPRPAVVELDSPLEPGAMGAVDEFLRVVVESGAAGALATAISTWMRTRRATLRLRVRRDDGAEIEIDAQVKDPDAAIERFLRGAPEP